MRLPILFATALPLLIAGCQVPTPANRMGESGIAAPGSWSATKEGRAGVDDGWISRMGSARLTGLVAEAQRHNPDLKIAAARVEQARTLVKSALGATKPSLEFEGLGNTNQRNFVGFPIPGAESGVLKVRTDSYSLNFIANWELDVWGRYRAATGAAVAAAQGAALDERAARAAIAAQVARAYFLLLESNEQVDLAEEAITVLQKTEQSLDEKFRGGEPALENLSAQLRLARSDVAAARAALQQRREIQGQAARALETLLGRYPQGDRHRGDKLPALTSSPPAGLPSELLQRRPDVLAAERRFAAQGMRQKEARRAVWPSLKLTGSAGTSTSSISDLLNSNFGVWSLGTKIFEPILTGGRVQAEIVKRRSEENEALAALQKTVLAAFSEVENALESERLLAAREAALAETARLAIEADTAARANFRDALGDILTVMVAQQRAIQSRSALAAVRRQRLDNRIALHLALGGDFHVR